MNGVFNIRVYGLLLRDNNEVLVSDEIVMGRYISKFPGGGMQYGEGTHDCLLREFMEELNREIRITGHFYTTDFFQASAFHPNNQVISIYYWVETESPESLPVGKGPFDFSNPDHNRQSFRWLQVRQSVTDDMTFPIDQKVLGMLKNYLAGL